MFPRIWIWRNHVLQTSSSSLSFGTITFIGWIEEINWFQDARQKKCLEKVNDYLENQRNPQPLVACCFFKEQLRFPKSLVFNCGVFFSPYFWSWRPISTTEVDNMSPKPKGYRLSFIPHSLGGFLMDHLYWVSMVNVFEPLRMIMRCSATRTFQACLLARESCLMCSADFVRMSWVMGKEWGRYQTFCMIWRYSMCM